MSRLPMLHWDDQSVVKSTWLLRGYISFDTENPERIGNANFRIFHYADTPKQKAACKGLRSKNITSLRASNSISRMRREVLHCVRKSGRHGVLTDADGPTPGFQLNIKLLATTRRRKCGSYIIPHFPQHPLRFV